MQLSISFWVSRRKRSRGDRCNPFFCVLPSGSCNHGSDKRERLQRDDDDVVIVKVVTQRFRLVDLANWKACMLARRLCL